MAVTIAELISKRKDIATKKAALYDIETSIGEITCKIPDAALISDAWDMKNSADSNKYLVYSCCVNPNLHNDELLRSFEVSEPEDIVDELFQPGEIPKIAGFLLRTAGFDTNITGKLHKTLKN